MSNFVFVPYFFAIIFTGWSPALAEGNPATSLEGYKRTPRHLLQNKLCLTFGGCGGYQGGYNNYQGGHGGYDGGNHNQGPYYNQGGYPHYPAIHIGISQSQSSSSVGGGGYGGTNYPNNFQYNGGHPNYSGNTGHKRPNSFGNGFGSNNNQFNGNYHGGNGGYGFRRPNGHDDDSSSEEDK